MQVELALVLFPEVHQQQQHVILHSVVLLHLEHVYALQEWQHLDQVVLLAHLIVLHVHHRHHVLHVPVHIH